MKGKKINFEEAGLSYIKLSIWAIGILFAIYSLIISIMEKDGSNILLCVVTLFLVSAPILFGRLLKFKLNTPTFIFIVLYALGPVLGCVHHLYYLTDWWDDLLHFTGGVVFAMFGIFFAGLINKKHGNSLMMSVVFAVCFSMAIAGLWEFYEFGSDMLFGTDMQMDTVVNEFTSYHLGTETGGMGTLTDIQDIVINGNSLGVGGYLDLGLIDSMKDMLLETFGAVLYGGFVLADRGKHPVFVSLKEEK